VSTNLLTKLATRGHEVTKISAFPDETKLENFRNVVIPVKQQLMVLLKEVVAQGQFQGLIRFPGIMKLVHESVVEMFQNPEIEAILQQRFDLVIVGYIFSDISILLARQLHCPVVVLWPRASFYGIDSLIGNISPLSSVDYSALNRKMNFVDRLKNIAAHLMSNTINSYLAYQQNAIYR
jgi:hypothetical protein